MNKEQNQQLIEKWSPLLENVTLGKITDQHRMATTAQLLEDVEREVLNEDAQTTTADLS